MEANTLTARELRQVLEKPASACHRAWEHIRQDILYLQAGSTSPDSQIQGMRLIEAGENVLSPDDPDEWPYQTALEAVKDGWRVISFPNMSLVTVPDDDAHGFGFEFILERWSKV